MKQTQEIINKLPEIIENGPSAETFLILENIGLSEEEIEKTLDIITQAIGRSGLYKAGLKPEQMSHYLDENPIFNKTIELVVNGEVNVQVDTGNLHPELKKAFNFDEDEEIDLEQTFIDFNNPENEDRAYGLYELLEHKHPKSSELIEKAINDEDEMVQITALQGVDEETVNETIVQEMLELFKQTQNHTLVSNLTGNFSDFNIQQAIPLLIEKLQSENLMIVYDCIFCLGEIADETVIDILVPFKEVRKCAEIYDEDGMLSESTGYTIRKITKKAIKKIKKRNKK